MLNHEETVLVLVDIQEKLVPVMYEKEALLDNLQKLIKGAQLLDIPILWLEQYPKGLGRTEESLKTLLEDRLTPIEKITFSAFGAEEFVEQLDELDRTTVLVAGIESHICVYQTVSDLLDADYLVEIVIDGITSRTKENRELGINKMLSIGAEATSVEMILFELLGDAQHENFREISRLIK